MNERIIEFQVSDEMSGGRADRILASSFEDLSRARLQRAFEAGQVTFEGRVIGKSFKVKSGGLLRAILNELETVAGPKPVSIPLEIVYEDETIVVVNKSAGMVTHPGSGTADDTLVHALLHHAGGCLSSVGAPERPGIVHRLDKETSGLIVVAKTDLAHHKLAADFSARKIFKRYRTLVLGVPNLSSGTIQEPIQRHPVIRTRMSIQRNGRAAHTDWSLEETFGDSSALISCVIHTGRTHQIRVHMSHLKHPLLGDVAYGFKSKHLPSMNVPRIMLHATELHIQHPERKERMEFKAPLPQDFVILMDKLKSQFEREVLS